MNIHIDLKVSLMNGAKIELTKNQESATGKFIHDLLFVKEGIVTASSTKTKRSWSKEELKVLRDAKKSDNFRTNTEMYKSVSVQLNRSLSSVFAKFRKLGPSRKVKPGYTKHVWTEEEDNILKHIEFKSNSNMQLAFRNLAEQMNRTYGSVSARFYVLKQKGLLPPYQSNSVI